MGCRKTGWNRGKRKNTAGSGEIGGMGNFFSVKAEIYAEKKKRISITRTAAS